MNPKDLYTHPAVPHEYNDRTNLFFHYIPDLLSDEEVEAAKAIFDAAPGVEGTVGINEGTEFVPLHNLRKCEVTYLNRSPDNQWLHEKLERVMLETNERFWKLHITDFGEVMRQMRYGPTDHFGSWHVDHGGMETAFRKLSLVVQLSSEDEYEGGKFEFAGSNLTDEPMYPNINPKKRGSAIIFPTYLFHRVTPVISGERRSLVFRACGPYFR